MFMEKLEHYQSKNYHWIEKELSVKELRQIIPLLTVKAFGSKCFPSLKKGNIKLYYVDVCFNFIPVIN